MTQGTIRSLRNDRGFGFISPDAGGSGQGLALHGTMMAIIGGALTVESRAGGGARVVLTLPTGPVGPTGPLGPTG